VQEAAGGLHPGRNWSTQRLWCFFFAPLRRFSKCICWCFVHSRPCELSCLRAVVEVVPVVAGAHPVVVGSGVVGLVVGVGRGVVELAGLGVLAGGLGVEGRSGLTVEGGEHGDAESTKLGAVKKE
jgi:hypothetical protein